MFSFRLELAARSRDVLYDEEKKAVYYLTAAGCFSQHMFSILKTLLSRHSRVCKRVNGKRQTVRFGKTGKDVDVAIRIRTLLLGGVREIIASVARMPSPQIPIPLRTMTVNCLVVHAPCCPQPVCEYRTGTVEGFTLSSTVLGTIARRSRLTAGLAGGQLSSCLPRRAGRRHVVYCIVLYCIVLYCIGGLRVQGSDSHLLWVLKRS